MKILHILSQTEMTGAEAYAKVLIENQNREGHEVFVFSEKLHVEIPVPWQSLPLSTGHRWQRLSSIKKLRQFIQINAIEVIHCHSRAAVRHAAWARVGTSAAMVTTLHGRQHFSFSKRLWNLYGEIQIAVCENVKINFTKNFGVHRDQIQVIGNPIPHAQRPMSLDSPTSHSAIRIAFIGRSSGPKGQRFEAIGLRYFEKWLQKYSFLQMDILTPHLQGFSEKFQSLLQQLREKYPQRFECHSKVQNLPEIIGQYHLVVGSGRVALEALAAKTLVYALGEYCDHGLVTADNFTECQKTNFGDMGPDDTFPEWNEETLGLRIENLLSARNSQETLQLAGLSQKILRFYSPTKVHAEIMKVYARAIFKRKHPRAIPHLMYHKVPNMELASKHRIFVTRERFKSHLDFFRENNFESICFSDLRDYIYKSHSKKFRSGDFPKKPLLLTFDDGYLDNLENAQPLLLAAGLRAHLFLLADRQIASNLWDAAEEDVSSKLLNADQRKQLDLRVWEIGSHGFSHPRLTEISDEELEREIRDSKVKLGQEFNCEILTFAYPFGIRDERVESFAREYYDFALNTDQGGLHLADNPHSLFRVNIFPEDGPRELRKKCSHWYRRYFYFKRGR